MRIMFYMDWPLAITYLEPIYRFLKEKEPTWNLFFASTSSSSLALLAEKDYPVSDPTGDYDYAFCCDGMSACPTSSKGKKICTFHGLASKGRELSSKRTRAYQDFPGYFIAPGHYYEYLLRSMGVSPEKIVVGGLSKFDTIKDVPPLRLNDPKILYAPTFNTQLSSIPIIGEQIYELPNLTIHLHNFTRTSEHPHHVEMNAKFSHYRDDREDITSAMIDSDIVFADMGSTVVEAIALGKFVIQVQNPHYVDFYLRVEKIRVREMDRLPEVFFPRQYAYSAFDMYNVREAIGRYPFKPLPALNSGILENIGHTGETIYREILCK